MRRLCSLLLLTLMCLTLTGCNTFCANCWENAKSFANYVHVQARNYFHSEEETGPFVTRNTFFGDQDDDYIPLDNKDLQNSRDEVIVSQAKDVPGDPRGRIPGISAFHKPKKGLENIFKKIYFHTGQHVPKTKEDLRNIDQIAVYLKKHPKMYVFIEGHCDERGSEALNLALGTRRSNHTRALLIKRGISPDRLFTVSYGKEQPELRGHNTQSWTKNRRVAFRIYQPKDSV